MSIAPLHLALAQPLLRGPNGRALVLRPGVGRTGVSALPLSATSESGESVWNHGHGVSDDRVPWLATPEGVHALLDGHRPLDIAPARPLNAAWPARLRPYPQSLSVQAGGLSFFFVNVSTLSATQGPGVRIFAVDDARAVECDPVPDACVLHAWAADGGLLACGMRPRRSSDKGVDLYGEALLLRFSLRPFACSDRWQDARRLTVPDAAAAEPALKPRLQAIEAWWTALPGEHGTLLLGAPLGIAHHGEPSPLWSLGVLGIGEHADLVVAHWPEADAPPRLLHLWADRSYVARCSGPGDALHLFLLHNDVDHLGQPTARRLRVARWAARGALQLDDAAMVIDGLPDAALDAPLADLDVIHHPQFGYAASLAWLKPVGISSPPGACEGVLLHSDDAVRWRVVQSLGR